MQFVNLVNLVLSWPEFVGDMHAAVWMANVIQDEGSKDYAE